LKKNKKIDYLCILYAGLDVQYIDWTRDVNYFLDILSCLAFNGDNNLNRNVMVEGLAKALMVCTCQHILHFLFITVLILGLIS